VSTTQIAIHISRTSVQVAEVLRSNHEIVRAYEQPLLENTAEGYKSELKSFFQSIQLQDDYAEYTMAWQSSKHTLVPLSVFNESSARPIYTLMFGEEMEQNTIDYNRLMELSMVSIYEIPDWVKSFFIIKFPQIMFKHEQAITLRALFQQSTYKRKLVVTLCDDYIDIMLIHQNELRFSNVFDFQSAEDILYHLLFVLEQKDIKEEEGSIHFYFNNKANKLIAEETKKLVEKHQILKKIKVETISSSLKLQTLCV
jgi:hypothetical protein